MPKKNKCLIIVESPVKSRKIFGIVSNGIPENKWDVVATFGHIKNLPKEELGIDEKTLKLKWINSSFTPKWRKKGQKTQSAIKKIIDAAKGCKTIYLSTDPDREGEAIAAHVYDELKKNKIKGKIKRATFNAITKKDVLDAIKNPKDIDFGLVAAQEARRALDRLIGYKISPALWKLGQGLSAGRVQSCALTALSDKEKEIRAFVPKKERIITAKTKKGKTASFKLPRNKKPTKEDAKQLLKYLEKNKDKMKKKVTGEKREIKPPPTYTTSALLQDASRIAGLSSEEAMKAAQKLFETGNITYHRTDSIHMSFAGVAALRNTLKATKHKKVLSPKPRNYPSKGQGAHEAIRPTHPEEKKPKGIVGDEGKKLYKLIRLRALATQCNPAVVEDQKMVFSCKHKKFGDISFTVTGTKVVKEGWTAVNPRNFDEPINKKDTIISFKSKVNWTRPGYRFTEHGLVDFLEKNGVGRPSTYASTLSVLLKRGYVNRYGKTLRPTIRGEFISHILKNNFPQIVNTKFTAKMEKKLDSVKDKKSYKKTVRKYWDEIEDWIKKADLDKYIDRCPYCGRGKLRIHVGYKGNPYIVCSNKKKCGEFFGVDFYKKEIVTFDEREIKGVRCKEKGCRGKAVLKQSKYGFFLQCKKCGKPIRGEYL